MLKYMWSATDGPFRQMLLEIAAILKCASYENYSWGHGLTVQAKSPEGVRSVLASSGYVHNVVVVQKDNSTVDVMLRY